MCTAHIGIDRVTAYRQTRLSHDVLCFHLTNEDSICLLYTSAIIFIQRMDGGQMKQEGYCLHCARELHIKPVDDLMKQFRCV